MKITWYGHAAFRLETAKVRILIDPFFEGNPSFEEAFYDAATKDLTHIALTHGHDDHVGDTVKIARETGAMVIANADLGQWLKGQGVDNVDMGNTGGTVRHDGFAMTWVQAFHSSASVDDKGVAHSLGMPNGLVFHMDGEKTVYHMGDTDIFGDMALIAELHQPQIAMVPVGDRFTMGGAVAALACQRYFSLETAIPCHFGSFPIIDQTADTFVAAMESSSCSVAVLEVGTPREF